MNELFDHVLVNLINLLLFFVFGLGQKGAQFLCEIGIWFLVRVVIFLAIDKLTENFLLFFASDTLKIRPYVTGTFMV